MANKSNKNAGRKETGRRDENKPEELEDEASSASQQGSKTYEEDLFGQGDDDPRTGSLGETLKRIISAGIGAAFMTEESIRSYLGEVRLPKDVLNIIVQSAGKSKEELLNRVGNEVVKIISKIDFVGEASRFVEEHKFRINAEIEVVKKEKHS
ncbi:MAG: hypothetical protein KDD35_03485 [Bdellovibrionales bacterium]|nr:hypothetical protein [Bdellovibrionales bacterium]